jgi:hypothetical protein
MTTVAEAYFNFRPFEIVPDNLEKLGNEISKHAARHANVAFSGDAIVEVRFELGSLRGWITVKRAGIGVFAIVVGYGELKAGLKEIISDAQWFGDVVIEEVKQRTEVPPAAIFRTERRTETPGRIYRAFVRLEQLEQNAPSMSPSEIEAERKAISALLRLALEDLSAEEAQQVRKAALQRYERLPRAADLISGSGSHRPTTPKPKMPLGLPPPGRSGTRVTDLPANERRLTFRPPEPTRYIFLNQFQADGIAPKGKLLLEGQQTLSLTTKTEPDGI